MMKPKIDIDRDKLAAFCRKWHIRRLWLFGSVLRDDFTDDSDVDVLYEFEEGKTPGWDIVRTAEELGDVFGGRKVDFISEQNVYWRIRQQPTFRSELIYNGNGSARDLNTIEITKGTDFVRDDLVYIGCMYDFCNQITKHLPDLTYEKFSENNMLPEVFCFAIQRIGRMSLKVSSEGKTRYPQLNWDYLAKLPSLASPDYLYMDKDAIWDVVKTYIPELKHELTKLT